VNKQDKRRERIENRLPDINQKRATCAVCGGEEEGDAWAAMGHATFYHWLVSKCVDNLKGQLAIALEANKRAEEQRAALKAEHAAELSLQVIQFQKILDAAKENGEKLQIELQAAKEACEWLANDSGFTIFFGTEQVEIDDGEITFTAEKYSPNTPGKELAALVEVVKGLKGGEQ
jgi:uncharacterized protein YacL (UPF0231 family)